MKTNIARRLYDEVSIGQQIDGCRYTPNVMHVNLMNIANWGVHRIHYDKEWAQKDGFDDVVVQGVLLYGWVEKMLTKWAADPACVRKLSFRNVSVPLAGQSFELSGSVVSKNPEKQVTCEVLVQRPNNERVVVCTAELQLA